MHEASDQGMGGVLYVVATPIGNLKDITFRAVEILTAADVIAAEDTRHTRKLLSHLNIKANPVSCHEHNESIRIPTLLEKLKSGMSVALVSDAGTPTVSDPGYRLVAAAIAQGIRVIPIPGASAVVSALSASGLPSDSFFFAGFLPAAPSKRRSRLEQLSSIPSTLIFYESPRRIVPVLADMLKILGNRPGVIAREMTKIHEEFLRGSLAELAAKLENMEMMKGEIAILVGPNASGDIIDEGQLEAQIESALKKGGASVSSMAKALSKTFGMPKSIIYQKILEMKSAMGGRGYEGIGEESNG
jgi:16S rRNA (cytidine1402-2'-O)-methyltransferase